MICSNLDNIETDSCLVLQDPEGLFPCILGHEAAGYGELFSYEFLLSELAYIPYLCFYNQCMCFFFDLCDENGNLCFWVGQANPLHAWLQS
jgi:hypothetical protein